jgi:hypothetical protein
MGNSNPRPTKQLSTESPTLTVITKDASFEHLLEQLSTESPTLAVITNDASFKHLPKQLSAESQTLSGPTEDNSFEHFPDDVIVSLFKLLSLEEFLNLRGVCQRLRTISFGLSVENSPLCCLSRPVKHAPSFAEDIKSIPEPLSFSWQLRQNSDFPSNEDNATTLLQMLTFEPESETSQDQVRCILIHSSDHRRRGQHLLKEDSLPELTPVFPIISEFRNLKSRTHQIQRFP